MPGKVFLQEDGGGQDGVLQAHGDGRSLQRALVAAFFANIVLNPLFIYINNRVIVESNLFRTALWMLNNIKPVTLRRIGWY